MRPDALAGLASIIEHEAVSSARIIGMEPNANAVQCSAGDGSRWWVATDNYGNAYGWEETLLAAVRSVAAQLKDPDRAAAYARLADAIEAHDKANEA